VVPSEWCEGGTEVRRRLADKTVQNSHLFA
jgi:hypothetical protein